MGDTFQGIVRMENSGVIGSRTSCLVSIIESKNNLEVLCDKKVVAVAGEAVNIPHHTGWAMEDLKEATKKFLSPTTDLMDGTVILQNFLDCAAVTQPKEFGTPKEFPVLANGSAPAASFAYKRMVVAFSFSAAAGAKPDRAQ
jgi:hypothetical protein